MIGDPMFFNISLDLDFPIIENDFLSIVFFTDGATLLPYFKNAVTEGPYSPIEAGFGGNTYWPLEQFQIRNIGLASGVFGNIWLLDYNLHARYFTGTFKPGFYGTNYDRVRSQYAIETAAYEKAIKSGDDLAAYESLNMGIYGQAGYTLPKIFSIDIGYMWPFQFDAAGKLAPATVDELHFKATLEKGVIPGIDLSGAISYDRTNFAPMLTQLINGGVNSNAYGWVDEFTVLKGEVIYGVSPNLDLVGLLSGAISRNIDGTIMYDANGNQQLDISFGFETNVHF